MLSLGWSLLAKLGLAWAAIDMRDEAVWHERRGAGGEIALIA